MTAQQAQSVIAPKRLPLVTEMANRDGTFNKDARLVNAFPEKDPQTGEYWVRQRVGLGPIPAYTLSGGGRGVFLVSNTTLGDIQESNVFVAGTNVYTTGLHLGVPVLVNIGTILPGDVMRFCQVPSSPGPYVVFGDGTNTYAIGGALTTIAHLNPLPNFPASCVPGIVYLDGTTYVMDVTATIWGSTTTDNIIDWDPLNFISAQIEPDAGVFLAKQLVYIVAMKQWTTEFFYDAGNATGSPLSPVEGAFIPYGCLNADTVQEIDGILMWVTASKQQSPQIMRLENLQPKIVSTPPVERILDIGNTSSVYRSIAFKYGGHRMYVISNLTNNVTMALDIDQGIWSPWTDPNGNYYPIVAQTIDLIGRRIFQHVSNGIIYLMDGDYVFPDDAGSPFPVDIYTPNYDGGVDRWKQLNVMRLNADQVTGSTVQMRRSEDDYQTWTNFRTFDMAQKRPILTNCGRFRRAAFHFRKLASTPFRIKSVDLQMDLGTL